MLKRREISGDLDIMPNFFSHKVDLVISLAAAP